MASRTDGRNAQCERADALPVGTRRGHSATEGFGEVVAGERPRPALVRVVRTQPCLNCGDPSELGERLCPSCLRDAAREAASHYTKGIA